MTNQDRFNAVVDRYKKAYFKYNGAKIESVKYEAGFVVLRSSKMFPASKHRIAQFEEMTNTLEYRLKN